MLTKMQIKTIEKHTSHWNIGYTNLGKDGSERLPYWVLYFSGYMPGSMHKAELELMKVGFWCDERQFDEMCGKSFMKISRLNERDRLGNSQ